MIIINKFGFFLLKNVFSKLNQKIKNKIKMSLKVNLDKYILGVDIGSMLKK